MNYGLYLSASGVLTGMTRQDIASNNLANVDTTGFKPIMAALRARQDVRTEDLLGAMPSNAMLEQLGGGVLLNQGRVSLRQGPVHTTGNPLDAAIHGDGLFVIESTDERGAPVPRLTRDGRMTLDDRGVLVRAADGAPVLDARGRQIRLIHDEPVQIAADGLIEQNGAAIAQLAVVDAPAERLKPVGGAAFELTGQGGGVETLPRGTGRVEQEAIEGSAVNPIKAMSAVSSAGGAVSRNAQMLRSHDFIMERAIRLGRVS